jgi:hypothetical protein
MNKKRTFLFIIIILFGFAGILKLGSYLSHRNYDQQDTFVGIVGKDTYVNNLSDDDITQRDVDYLWRSYLRGAPAPFQAIRTFSTKRIEILDSDFDQVNRCGSFLVHIYGRFNKKLHDKFPDGLTIKDPCP